MIVLLQQVPQDITGFMDVQISTLMDLRTKLMIAVTTLVHRGLTGLVVMMLTKMVGQTTGKDILTVTNIQITGRFP